MLLYNAFMGIRLEKIDAGFSVCKITDINGVDFSRPFVFLSKTDEELSLVCESSCVPKCATDIEADWKAFRVAGTLDFSLIGIVAKLTKILAAEGISVFVISTYNTDYILVKAYNFERALAVLGDTL